MGIETIISGVLSLASAASKSHEAELAESWRVHPNNPANIAAQKQKDAETKLEADRLTAEQKQKTNQESYQATIDRLNQQFEQGLAETDASGNPTDLGLAMKQIVSNFQETSQTAIRQWAYERGVAGSTIEGTKINEASTKAQESAQAYKQTEANRLYTQKEDLTNKAKDVYNMGNEADKLGLNLDVNALNSANAAVASNPQTQQKDWFSTFSDVSPDLAALSGNINDLFKTKTVTGYDKKAGTIFNKE